MVFSFLFFFFFPFIFCRWLWQRRKSCQILWFSGFKVLGFNHHNELPSMFLMLYVSSFDWIRVLFIFLFIQISNYEKELEEMKHMTRQEYVASLRRYLEIKCCIGFLDHGDNEGVTISPYFFWVQEKQWFLSGSIYLSWGDEVCFGFFPLWNLQRLWDGRRSIFIVIF